MTTLTAEVKSQTQTTEVHTCRECGETGPDMVGNYYYVGGEGDVFVYECQDCILARWKASIEARRALKLAMLLGKS